MVANKHMYVPVQYYKIDCLCIWRFHSQLSCLIRTYEKPCQTRPRKVLYVSHRVQSDYPTQTRHESSSPPPPQGHPWEGSCWDQRSIMFHCIIKQMLLEAEQAHNASPCIWVISYGSDLWRRKFWILYSICTDVERSKDPTNRTANPSKVLLQ